MRKVPTWTRPLLYGGGILNLALAVFFLLMPGYSHQLLFGSAPFMLPQAIQIYGILLAAFGLGYLAVGLSPLNNTAVLIMAVVANLLFALYLPIAANGLFWQFTAVVLWSAAALVWCMLLVSLLSSVAKARQTPQSLANAQREPLSKTLTRFRTQRGKSLLQLSNERPTLVVFLRQFGSSFCRETLNEIQKQRRSIENQGTQIVLVHLAEQTDAMAALEKLGMADLHHISDPNGIMYTAFGLKRGSFKHFFSWQRLLRKAVAGMQKRQETDKQEGGTFRIPGAFLISKGEIVRSFRDRSASQRSDFRQLASGQAA